jgi:2-polyprenyl-3-methyl-5-hydroxy-6-metoxy-1,4-benzoquinol methylase
VPSKLRFLTRILRHRWNGQSRCCPYCGPGSHVVRIRRKKLVLDIMRCDNCRLVFRWPTDTAEEIDAYYDDEYTPEYPQVQLPGAQELDGLLRSRFAGSPLDLSAKIDVLRSLRPSGRLLDFGCSWGYGTWQLAQSGYNATGFEISKPRAAYARTKLAMTTFDRLEDLKTLSPASFDVIFTNHVVEHLLNLKEVFELMKRLLAPGGIAFHVLPNFTGKTALSGSWILWIGEEHPIAPNIEFFRATLPRHGFVNLRFGSSPFEKTLAAAMGTPGDLARTDGDELLVYAERGLSDIAPAPERGYATSRDTD